MKKKSTIWVCDQCKKQTDEWKDAIYWYRVSLERSDIIQDAHNRIFNFCSIGCLGKWATGDTTDDLR